MQAWRSHPVSKLLRFDSLVILPETAVTVSKVPNRSGKVILNLFQDLIINGLRFRNEFGMTLSGTFDTALFLNI